jgi:hypothetical protein
MVFHLNLGTSNCGTQQTSTRVSQPHCIAPMLTSLACVTSSPVGSRISYAATWGCLFLFEDSSAQMSSPSLTKLPQGFQNGKENCSMLLAPCNRTDQFIQT